MKINIICRGGIDVGMGHIYRAKAFAQEVINSGHKVRFIALLPKELSYLLSCFEEVYCVDNDQKVADIIKRENSDIVIFDLISIHKDVFETIKKCATKVISISPVFDYMDKIDILFTRGKAPELNNSILVYSGLEYTIIRNEIVRIRDEEFLHNLSNESLQIGISMGGADALNKTHELLKVLANLNIHCTFWLMLGDAYQHSCDHLIETIFKNRNQNIVIARAHNNIWDLARNCNLMILTGGVSVMEAAYVGLPTLLVYEYPEHMSATPDEIINSGGSHNFGIINEETYTEVAESLEYYNANKFKLMEMRSCISGLVDKFASKRIINILETIIG